jgi:hypothetical protein
MLRRSIIMTKQLFHIITVRNWARELRACGERYDRWITVGDTSTDFLSYLIAVVSASTEDSLEHVCREGTQSFAIVTKDSSKATPNNGINSPPAACLPVSLQWPVFDLWHLRTRQLGETMQMASSDMQHWTQRLMRSWIAALTVGNSVAAQRLLKKP